MMTTQKKEKIQTIIVVSCVIFAVMLICALIYNAVLLGSKNARIRHLEAQLDEIEKALLMQESDIAYRQTDEYLDKYAREYLNMKGEDEIVFIAK